jgi:predicted Zn-dependent protease
MSQQEADRIQPDRLDFHVVRAGETWSSIAQQLRPAGGLRPETLAIMNGSDPQTPPRAGDRIRVIVGS